MASCCYVGRYLGSTLGLKVLMALTGFLLFGFTLAHVSGNLLVFAGPETMAEYAAMLHGKPGALWAMRLVLLAAVAVHVACAVKLTMRKGEARPVAYGLKRAHGSSYASRTMMWSGPILALFIVYHLMHFTVGNAHPDFRHLDPHHNLVTAFRSPAVAGVYIVAMLSLALHLAHGVWSLTQTLGVNRPNWEPALRKASIVFGVAVAAGFTAVPVSILLGIVK